MTGFILSILLSFAAVILVVHNNSFWVVFVVISIIVSTLSVFRADTLYKENKEHS